MNNDLAVFSLLATSAVVLAIALANLSATASCVGVAAYVSSLLIDNRHERTLGRPPQPQR